jgi:uncharacterized membrane protein YdjX (TVP38/TMEM64 family)
VTGHLQPMLESWWEAFQGREQLRDYVETWGALAPAAFVFMQALQVVVAPIPGEFTGAVGGFIFGTFWNTLYSTIGLTLGSVLAFVAARIIGLPFVRLVVSDEFLEKFHFLAERRATALAFVLFIIPGFPKDMLCYFLGLSPMGFVAFLIACAFGRIPGTVMLSFCGCAVYDENWTLLICVSIVAASALALFYLYRERIELWLRKTGSESL